MITNDFLQNLEKYSASSKDVFETLTNYVKSLPIGTFEHQRLLNLIKYYGAKNYQEGKIAK